MPAVEMGEAAPPSAPIHTITPNRKGDTPSSMARAIAGRETIAMAGAGPAPVADTTMARKNTAQGRAQDCLPTAAMTLRASRCMVSVFCTMPKRNMVPNRIRNMLVGKPARMFLSEMLQTMEAIRAKAIATTPVFMPFAKPRAMATTRRTMDRIATQFIDEWLLSHFPLFERYQRPPRKGEPSAAGLV